MAKENSKGIKMEDKFAYFDEIYFRKVIMDEMDRRSFDADISPF